MTNQKDTFKNFMKGYKFEEGRGFVKVDGGKNILHDCCDSLACTLHDKYEDEIWNITRMSACYNGFNSPLDYLSSICEHAEQRISINNIKAIVFWHAVEDVLTATWETWEDVLTEKWGDHHE